MTLEDIQQAAREHVVRSRAEQGLPPRVTDPVILQRLATLLEVRPPIGAPVRARPRKRAA